MIAHVSGGKIVPSQKHILITYLLVTQYPQTSNDFMLVKADITCMSVIYKMQN